MLPIFYYNKCLRSTLYSLFLGIFFALTLLGNQLNFATSDPTLDLAPVIAKNPDIAAIPAPENTPLAPATSFVAIAPSYRTPARSSSYITIGGRSIAIYKTNSLDDDAGSRVAKYGSKFYYGHNSASVFGVLSSLPNGTTFSITENNITSTYRIASHEIFLKNGSNILNRAADIGDPKYENLPLPNYAGIYNAQYRSNKYDLALMTCHGKSLGGGDAAERYVVFAYKV